MGITQLIEPFYIDISGERFRDKPVIGQLCWVPSPQPNVIPQILEVERADPTEHYITRFKIRNVQETDFQRKDELPIHRMKLRLHEELIIQKAKRRPAILLPLSNILFKDVALILKSKGKKHLQQDCLIAVPIFDIERPDDPTGFPPIMVARIKALMYNQFFYCPRPGINLVPVEGVARFDRIQVIYPGHRASFNPLPIKLSEDSFTILIHLLRSWLCIKGDPGDEKYLKELKALLKDTVSE
jgi:hypothetical protein